MAKRYSRKEYNSFLNDIANLTGGTFSPITKKEYRQQNRERFKKSFNNFKTNIKDSFEPYKSNGYEFSRYSLLPLIKLSLVVIVLVVFLTNLNMSDTTLLLRPFENVRVNGTIFNPNVSFVDYDWIGIKGKQLSGFIPLIDYDSLNRWNEFLSFSNGFIDSTIGTLYRLLASTFLIIIDFLKALFVNLIQFFKFIFIW